MRDLFGTDKPIIGMAHLPPLPGAPGYDADRGIRGLIDWVAADLEALTAGGVDAVLFGNEGDRPYVLRAPPEGLAAMTAVVCAVKGTLGLPFGVDYLWDPVASVALAAATGAQFAREVFTGVYDSDMGLWRPDCAGALRLRAALGREDLKLFFNINAEFAAPVGQRPIAERTASVVLSSLPDAICVSGPRTGQPPAESDLAEAKRAAGAVPVFANTGVNLDSAAEVLQLADGAIVGTHFKRDGDTWQPVDRDRVARFMAAVQKLR